MFGARLASLFTILILVFLVSESTQEDRPVVMGMDIKAKANMVEDMEFMQLAVERLQRLIDTKNVVSGNGAAVSGTTTVKHTKHDSFHGQRVNSQGIVGALECEACWIGAQVIDYLVDQKFVKKIIEGAAWTICSTELAF